MNIHFLWEALIVLTVGFCLLRIVGKKTVGEMTGLEIITLLAMASMIGHAISDKGLWYTVATLCVFAAMLVAIQYLSIKINWVEKWFMGKATLVIKNGQIIPDNLRKLRMSVDQLEARLREKGITSFADIQTATVEMSGQIGFEYARHAKPVTVGDLEQLLALIPPQLEQPPNLFREVIYHEHENPIDPKLD